MKRKNSLFLCYKKYFLGLTYAFAIVFIIISGNKRNDVVTSNINTVKSVKSYRLIASQAINENFKRVSSVAEIKEYGNDNQIEFTGTMTGYGPDCEGCGGKVGCYPRPDVRNNNIYFEDEQYGRIRILAADKSIPCGSIIKISNYKYIDGEFYGIVLDRGSSIVGLTMDLLYASEKETIKIGRNYNIVFKVIRWGWE